MEMTDFTHLQYQQKNTKLMVPIRTSCALPNDEARRRRSRRRSSLTTTRHLISQDTLNAIVVRWLGLPKSLHNETNLSKPQRINALR